MTTIVAHVSTGRSGQTATIRGTGRLSGQVVTTAASTTDVTWTHTRWQVLKFAVADAAEVTPQQAGYAATVLMCIWANESGWGANEWNFNGCGMHCSSGDAQCTEWPRDGEDPRLAAYGDLAEAMRAFFRLVWTVRTTADERAALLRGELVGLAGLYRRGVFGLSAATGMTREETVSALFRGVRARLAAGGAEAALIAPYAPMAAGAIGAAAASVTGVGTVSGATGAVARTSRKGAGALLFLGLLAAAAMSSKKKGR